MRHRTLKEVSRNMSAQVREVTETGEASILTRYGQPCAILIPFSPEAMTYVAAMESAQESAWDPGLSEEENRSEWLRIYWEAHAAARSPRGE